MTMIEIISLRRVMSSRTLILRLRQLAHPVERGGIIGTCVFICPDKEDGDWRLRFGECLHAKVEGSGLVLEYYWTLKSLRIRVSDVD